VADTGSTLAERLASTPYDAYVYAYPHKTAYGPLDPAPRLEDVWRDEDTRALSLYIHVPFCEMRCGFCNLFTTPNPPEEVIDRYAIALERQAHRVAQALGDRAAYARFAVGGGTPTLLDAPALMRLLDVAERVMGVDLEKTPGSVETSPETCSPERMEVLRSRGVERISIGVQSFVESESAAVFRPQKNAQVFAAIDAIRRAGFPILNIDLIYGLPDQTEASWERSLQTALEWRPEELHLYPLYVRPVTSLSKRQRSWDDLRLSLYHHARDLLKAAGYEQVSMRMFQKKSLASSAPVYCVQDDGMVGLGPGARSYTRGLHYSTEWAVGASSVRAILGSWLADEGFGEARWGFALDGDEQRRRWVAYALFTTEGLDLAQYRARFGTELLDDLSMMNELVAAGAASVAGDRLKLTDLGLERSDTLGPWLYSSAVRSRMQDFTVR